MTMDHVLEVAGNYVGVSEARMRLTVVDGMVNAIRRETRRHHWFVRRHPLRKSIGVM